MVTFHRLTDVNWVNLQKLPGLNNKHIIHTLYYKKNSFLNFINQNNNKSQ